MTPCSAAACGQLLQARELAVGLLAHLLGQLSSAELLAQLVRLGLGLVRLAELLLDRLELLAQEVLALASLSISDWTWDWIFEPIAMISSSRARISESRRSRLATSSSSSSSCFSSVLMRSAPAIRWASADGSSRLATAICSSSGR